MTNKTIALIMAAGWGTRINTSLPKQYIPLGNFCPLAQNIIIFSEHESVDSIQVVINQRDIGLYDQIIGQLADKTKLLPAIFGGEKRQDSVRLGLLAIKKFAPETVLIHDAARPFITRDLIDKLLNKRKESIAVIAAAKISDTVKKIPNQQIEGTINRSYLYLAQTPQVFDYNIILAAHQDFQNTNCTDDAELCEKANITVEFVESGWQNFKITTKNDLHMAHKLAANYETRIGIGFDAHRFIKAKHENNEQFITLCGVKISYDRVLKAHSDGDVALHALTDAMLGALGEADIGTYFPPSDPQWHHADSRQFVRYAHNLVKTNGGQIINIDVTIICEEPKIGPYRQEMKFALAEILDISEKRVSVKATTTEEMGFTGRREGIAAQAAVSIRLPISY